MRDQIKMFVRGNFPLALSALVSLVKLTAVISTGTASSWGPYQPKVPEALQKK